MGLLLILEVKIRFMHIVATKLAEAVAEGSYDRGILICGTGIGVCLAASKVKGAYPALLTDIYSAKRARLSNNANIACFGAFTIGNKLREELLDAFLNKRICARLLFPALKLMRS